MVALVTIVVLQIGVAYLVTGRDGGELESGLLMDEGHPIGGDFAQFQAEARADAATKRVKPLDSQMVH